ncbi:MAG: hypothetical protein GY853_01245 [PVC group bacterium]|nr:hypothetical protein [PVC group bacterium]
MDKNYNKSIYLEYIENGQIKEAEQYLKDQKESWEERKEYKAEMEALGTPVPEGVQSVTDIYNYMKWSFNKRGINADK